MEIDTTQGVMETSRWFLNGQDSMWNILIFFALGQSAVGHITRSFTGLIESLGMLTLGVEDTLNIVYFDGSSGSNSYLGHQDSQDVVIWGRVRKDKMAAEWERLDELCRWGQPFNIDGFIR